MGRRVLLTGAAVSGALVLSSCGFRDRGLVRRATWSVEEVEGVVSVALEAGTGAMFEQVLTGRVQIDAGRRSAGLATYDEAMREIVTLIHDHGRDRMRVGGIYGVLTSGEELNALDLDPDMPTSDPRLDRVTARAFYGKYGLE